MTPVTKLLSAALVVAGLAATASAQVPSPLAGRVVPVAPGEPHPGYPPHWPAPWPPVPRPPHHHYPPADIDYAVYFRPHWGGWRYYGTYETRWQAERAVASLEVRGLRAKVVPFRDGPSRPRGPW
jgi:hypothetical protein